VKKLLLKKRKKKKKENHLSQMLTPSEPQMQTKMPHQHGQSATELNTTNVNVFPKKFRDNLTLTYYH
jgi:hypothetical protein